MLLVACMVLVQFWIVMDHDDEMLSTRHSQFSGVAVTDDANSTNISLSDPEAADCTEILEKFRADEIEVTKTRGKNNYHRAFATVTKTDKPFYVATHDDQIDAIRSSIMKYQRYYEKQLTARVAEIFEEKSAQGEESIMLDVGANIGWFSLVAAAHGATKVYSFEPNMQNTVRFCESQFEQVVARRSEQRCRRSYPQGSW